MTSNTFPTEFLGEALFFSPLSLMSSDRLGDGTVFRFIGAADEVESWRKSI
jgi:hypothetical protein